MILDCGFLICKTGKLKAPKYMLLCPPALGGDNTRAAFENHTSEHLYLTVMVLGVQ